MKSGPLMLAVIEKLDDAIISQLYTRVYRDELTKFYIVERLAENQETKT